MKEKLLEFCEKNLDRRKVDTLNLKISEIEAAFMDPFEVQSTSATIENIKRTILREVDKK